MVYLEDTLEKAVYQWCKGRLCCTHSLFGSPWRQSLQVVLFGRWSWKGHSLVTLWKALLCKFIVQVFKETQACGVDITMLFRRWSWKGHLLVTLGMPLHVCLGLLDNNFWHRDLHYGHRIANTCRTRDILLLLFLVLTCHLSTLTFSIRFFMTYY